MSNPIDYDYPRHGVHCELCARTCDCGAEWCAEKYGDQCPDCEALPFGGDAA